MLQNFNEAFPKLSESPFSQEYLNTTQFDWAAPDIRKLAAIIDTLFFLRENDTFEMLKWAYAFLEDSRLPGIEATDRIVADLIDVVRFIVAAPALHVHDASGHWGKAYDLVWAAISPTYQVGIGRTEQKVNFNFFGFDPKTIHHQFVELYFSSLPIWVGATFHTAVELGGLDQLTRQVASPAWHFLDNPAAKHTVHETIFARLQMLHWASKINWPEGQKWADEILAEYDSTKDEHVGGMIATVFTTDAAKFTKKTPLEWVGQVLDEHPNFEASESHKLKMLCVTVQNPHDWVTLKHQIFSEISVLRARFEASTPSYESFDEVLESRVRTLNPLIFSLAEFGEVKDFVELFSAWRGVPPEQQIDDNVLVVLPTMSPGTRYLWPSGRMTAKSSSVTTHDKLQHEMGAALGLVLRGMDGDRVPDTFRSDRLDITIPSRAPKMEKALIEHYGISELKSLFPKDLCVKSIIIFAGGNAPVQALLSRHLGIDAPIEASFKNKSDPREIRNISVWVGSTYSSDSEIRMLRHICKKEGWWLELIDGEERTVEHFKEWYENDKTDVLWMISHGAYDPHSIEGMRLDIGNELWVELSEMQKWQIPKCGQRLLVLNACNSSTVQGRSGLPRIGFAPMLANSNQNVLGNLWPVNPNAATIFGTCVAVSLRDVDLERASTEAIKLFQDRKRVCEEIEVMFNGELPDLCERLLRFLDLIEPITAWGAPVAVC